jgi:hypothetical protein
MVVNVNKKIVNGRNKLFILKNKNNILFTWRFWRNWMICVWIVDGRRLFAGRRRNLSTQIFRRLLVERHLLKVRFEISIWVLNHVRRRNVATFGVASPIVGVLKPFRRFDCDVSVRRFLPRCRNSWLSIQLLTSKAFPAEERNENQILF